MKKLFIVLMIMLSFSCKHVIDEVRIYENSVELLAPADAVIINDTDISFAWNTVNGASEYVIQIATPDFTNPIQIVTDSTVTANSFSRTLLVATSYEWRVKAKNPNYETAFATRSLVIQ